jgi:hypothetical protein
VRGREFKRAGVQVRIAMQGDRQCLGDVEQVTGPFGAKPAEAPLLVKRVG